jgi:hypothetical protein
MTGSFTQVTVTGTVARDLTDPSNPSGEPVPFAEVSFDLDEGMVNGGTAGSGLQATANASGVFSITVDATNDSGTTSEGTTGPPQYHVHIKDPQSGEDLYDFRCPVPASPTTTTLTALLALAD